MMLTTKQHLFMILFFTGIVPCVLSETRMYFLVQQKKSWTDARIYCRAKHSDLAIIKTNNDTIQLQKAAQGLIFFFSAWIGMYSDINSWRWSLNNKPVGGMRLWDGGEPNNKYGHQNCGSISHRGWWDQACDLLYPFMCFDETKTGSDRYIYINNRKQWHDAQSYCRWYHTDLASARDENENSVILGKITGVTWFGLIKDPWKWVDNTTLSTINWMVKQPDNKWSNENCGCLFMGHAADAQCTMILPFFCYSETAKQQILRIKIQFDQDLNDPTVNGAILEKITQKLKEHGMDIVVKWRVKPNRVISVKK